MKHLFLLLAGLCLSVFLHAQVKTSHVIPDSLKVTLSENKMFIIYKNLEIPAANIQVLDSLIKKVPIKQNLSVHFESMNADPAEIRSINLILKKCECPTSRHSITMQKQ